jgi:hypothetical protein
LRGAVLTYPTLVDGLIPLFSSPASARRAALRVQAPLLELELRRFPLAGNIPLVSGSGYILNMPAMMVSRWLVFLTFRTAQWGEGTLTWVNASFKDRNHDPASFK